MRNKNDFRPESYNPIDRGQSIKSKEWVKNWEERKRIIFKETIFTNMKYLIEQAKDKNTYTSLAIFKPKEILSFKTEPTTREWDADKMKKIEEEASQFSLFESNRSDKPHEIFHRVNKLPYKFFYSFKDEMNNVSTLMIEDWEIGALYWNCLKDEQNEQKVIQKVKQKYFDEFKEKDLYLFLGTTQKFHNIAPNPFIIIGIFYPPRTDQTSLL